jgi:emp24/gp25L/p24 family/GOLD
VLKIGGEVQGEEEDEALIKSKESLTNIKKGITKIMIQQQRDRHRLSLHSETNVISHNRVVAGSILETGIFIAAALFQIFIVRRWMSARTAAINNPNAKQRA